MANIFAQNQNIVGKVTLSNGIECTIVNAEGDTITTMISIAGGLCATKQKPGVDSLITTIYTMNIKSELEAAGLHNIKVTNSTGDYQSAIFIDCESKDLQKALTTAGHALVYGKVSVDDAERLVEEAKRQKRQDNMNVFQQLYYAGLKKLYGNQSTYTKAYEIGEILQGVTFNDIEALMVYFLNAGLYSIVVTGGTSEGVGSIMEASFGDLQRVSEPPHPKTDDSVIKKDDTVRVKVQRVFKGDGKQGDTMPDVLVPTKVFFDPMLFFIKESDMNQRVLSNALNLLVNALNNNNDKLFDTVEILRRADCVTIILEGVKDKSKCAKLFSSSIKAVRAIKDTKVIRVETY